MRSNPAKNTSEYIVIYDNPYKKNIDSEKLNALETQYENLKSKIFNI